jgi:hypothetical protein
LFFLIYSLGRLLTPFNGRFFPKPGSFSAKFSTKKGNDQMQLDFFPTKSETGLPDGLFSSQKIQILPIFGGS